MNEHEIPQQEAVEKPVSVSQTDPRMLEGYSIPAGSPAAKARQPYPRRRAGKRELILAGVLLVFCFLLWDAVCWAEGLGAGEALGLIALLPAALVYLRNRPGKLRGYGLCCAVLYLLGAVSLAFSGDQALKFLTLCALALLFFIVILERLELRTGLGLFHRIYDLVFVSCSMTLGRLEPACWALSHSGSADGAHSQRNRAALLGLVCAAPVLLVLVPLLIASDAAFEGLVGSLNWDAAGRGLAALGLGAMTALLLFALLFTSDRGPEPLPNRGRKGLEPAAVTAFLGAVSAAYVLYLLSQFAYFTDAFRGLLPKDYSVAQYARRGFFEMCWIVAINLALIAGSLALCRRAEDRIPGAVKALALFLCVFSLVLVATALSKMVLYMRSYGLTRLRVLTSVFMGFLAVVVAAEGLRLFVKRVPVIKLAVTLGALVLMALSLANVDGLVARYNVNAWKSGRLDSLDMNTICWLGDGAVPMLTELAEDPDSKVAERAQKELKDRRPTGDGDLRSWNLVTQQAIEALEAYHS